MHTTVKRNILPFTDLTCITTDKFKTGFITINFITPLSAKTAGKNALLPRVLRCGTSEHLNRQSLSSALDNLYGASIEPIVRKKGEALCLGLYASFIDDDFIRPKEYILEKTISLMGEILLSPATRGGLLLDKFVENEKNILIDEIRNEKNDKIRYAILRLLENMCKEEAYGVNTLGTEESVKSITNRSLTKHYKEILSNAKIEIIYCGSSDIERVENAIIDALATLPKRTEPLAVETKVVLSPKSDSFTTVIDKMDVSQGKLTLGYRIGNTMNSPNHAALMVFNAIFGGSVTSKLFLNVRERLSLCYYASSMLDRHKGIMVAYSGVEFENFQKAFDEISNQLSDIRNGNISDYELESARKYISTSIRSRLDSASGIEDFYLDSAIFDIPVSPETLALNAMLVKKSDVEEIAKNVILDTVHYITSAGGDDNEA